MIVAILEKIVNRIVLAESILNFKRDINIGEKISFIQHCIV